MASKADMIFKNQSGTALVVALMMMVVITLIALASSYTSIFEIRISGNKRALTNAFYGADACINAIQPYTSNFDLSKYTLLPNSTSVYNPFSDSSIPNPTKAKGNITALLNQTGPPRGGGFSAVSVAYTYYDVLCTGCDTAGSGATSQIHQDVMRLLPIE
jgi:hypothetical protein